MGIDGGFGLGVENDGVVGCGGCFGTTVLGVRGNSPLTTE
jgi:hypothetical protein